MEFLPTYIYHNNQLNVCKYSSPMQHRVTVPFMFFNWSTGGLPGGPTKMFPTWDTYLAASPMFRLWETGNVDVSLATLSPIIMEVENHPK